MEAEGGAVKSQLFAIGVAVFGAAAPAALTACGGVSNDIVRQEANQIDKNAGVAQALHSRCVDAGSDASPEVVAQLCAAEMRALMDIHSNAAELLRAAGASDGGAAGEQ